MHHCHKSSSPNASSCGCFGSTRHWIFDLDNTLYPAECNLFAQIDERMGAFLSDYLGVDRIEARRVQKQFYYDHGTTLAGLMKVHGLAPRRFLDFVHDIDLSPLPELPALAKAISDLPGKRFIFTNGSRAHAEGVAGKLGVLHLFDEIYDIEASGFVPKPHADSYDGFLTSHGVEAASAAMFEDLPHNLEVPHKLGMTTILVKSDFYKHPEKAKLNDGANRPHIHHSTQDLTGFLERIQSRPGNSRSVASRNI